MLTNILLVFHVLFAVAIIALILLQQGKGAEAGAAFGAGASGTVFGAQGSASFLTRATAILAALFFISSLGLAYLANEGAKSGGSVVDQVIQQKVEQKAPVAGTKDDTKTEPAKAEQTKVEQKKADTTPAVESKSTQKKTEKPVNKTKSAPALPVSE